MNSLEFSGRVLADYGASVEEIQELLAYNQNKFNHAYYRKTLPKEPEPHIQVWLQYMAESQQIGVYASLKAHLVQFQFPIKQGISQTPDYRQATLQGKSEEGMSLKTGLTFKQPEQLSLIVHETLAGLIPVIIAGDRADFITLVQALTKRNEPYLIPDSMGACTVGNYNNWERIRQYKAQWIDRNPNRCDEADWQLEFQHLILKKELYQDRFIILSTGNYSNVRAEQLGLTESQWLELSLKIRLEHECTHYITRRWFDSMQNNLYDELIADYRGIVAALGYYKVDWFLHFLGLESFPTYRSGGRLENYKGNPALSPGALKILQKLLKTAAENLARFEQQYIKPPRNSVQETAFLYALTSLRLEELASTQAMGLLNRAMEEIPEVG
ncbi:MULTISPECIES: DUF7005 family protein [unclassified Microcystis]|nr:MULTISPECIES: hypothetical protein [unclassified Microcystis]KXS88901.1 hypothetical protein OA58_24575 [Microcystis aeruginosa NIES-88]MCA2725517.1 hypothetical protein [Microcystis sp. M166S2]MCA2891803.1 hypothetical protein [Microcystis sp. M048S1]MCA2899417.1 hypothetical protein [Microcystis sp. M039S1]MCA2899560.1 hypothetical protein [Microcystis sp. M035S1]MCA2945767.1 hypothetical protein [Microcystis sp. M011S1]MCA6373597.1 hypothetical protein [Cytophagales bacterium]TRT69602